MSDRFADVSMSDARRGTAKLWNLLSDGVSLEGAAGLAAFGAANRRELTPSFRTTLIARTSEPAWLPNLRGFRGTARTTVRQHTRIAQRLRTCIKRRASRPYIIYQ